MEAMKNPPTSGPLEKWRLFFKLFCFIKPQNVPNESIEAAFMFEQVRRYVSMRNILCTCVHVVSNMLLTCSKNFL